MQICEMILLQTQNKPSVYNVDSKRIMFDMLRNGFLYKCN